MLPLVPCLFARFYRGSPEDNQHMVESWGELSGFYCLWSFLGYWDWALTIIAFL
jgi:hypothetical protein